MRRGLAAAVVAVALGAAGCGVVRPRPVDLAGAWPEAAPSAKDFARVDRAWTRRAVLRRGFEQVLDVHATFRSPAWRAAWAERDVAVRGLPPADAEQVRALARAAADGDYEVTLVVVANERAENDLDRGERSIWRVSLVDDHGVETPAARVTRDLRPPDVLRTEIATFGDFAEVYTARFPRAAAVLRPDARQVGLKIAGTRGRLILTWLAP